MAAQQQGLAQLQEQFALYQHIQSYHWLADAKEWKEVSKLFAEDIEFEFDYVPTEADESGGCCLYMVSPLSLAFSCSRPLFGGK